MTRSIAIPAWILVLTAVLSTAAGCSTYDRSYRYQPAPVEVTAAPATDEKGPLRTLATIIGVRRANHGEGLPAAVEARFRIENPGPEPVSLDPDSITLISSNVQEFPTAILEPYDLAPVEPNQAKLFNVYFPFPDDKYPGGFDLAGLNLKWTLRQGNRHLTQTATFERRRVRNDPFPYYYHYHYYRHRYGYWFDCD